MKKFKLILSTLLMVGLSATATAQDPSIPPPANPAKPKVAPPVPKIASITLDWTHMKRSKNRYFYDEKKSDAAIDEGAIPGFYATAQICTTFRGITRCQQVNKTPYPYESGNNTDKGTLSDRDRGGAFSDRKEKEIDIDSMTITKEQARDAANKNRDEIIKELTDRFWKQSPDATRAHLEEHLELMDLGDGSNNGLRDQAPHIQVSILHFRDDTWSSNEHVPAGNVIIPLDELVKKVNRGAYQKLIPDTNHSNNTSPVKVGDTYPAWGKGRVWGQVQIVVQGEVEPSSAQQADGSSAHGAEGLPQPELGPRPAGSGTTPAPAKPYVSPIDRAFAYLNPSEQPASINGLAYESPNLVKVLPEDNYRPSSVRPDSTLQAI